MVVEVGLKKRRVGAASYFYWVAVFCAAAQSRIKKTLGRGAVSVSELWN